MPLDSPAPGCLGTGDPDALDRRLLGHLPRSTSSTRVSLLSARPASFVVDQSASS